MSYKILTIDDSRMVRMIVTKAFSFYGCEIYEATNGTEGLAMAEEVRPDLIFLDITMDPMNGLVVLEKLRQHPVLLSTPVIMLTAESGITAIERADRLIIDGYVTKPFKAAHLIELAGKILHLQPSAAA